MSNTPGWVSEYVTSAPVRVALDAHGEVAQGSVVGHVGERVW
jgi:hypothetical protein